MIIGNLIFLILNLTLGIVNFGSENEVLAVLSNIQFFLAGCNATFIVAALDD